MKGNQQNYKSSLEGSKIEFVTKDIIKDYLKSHPLIQMLGGMPLAISIFAS
jgi:hypothetical protein